MGGGVVCAVCVGVRVRHVGGSTHTHTHTHTLFSLSTGSHMLCSLLWKLKDIDELLSVASTLFHRSLSPLFSSAVMEGWPCLTQLTVSPNRLTVCPLCVCVCVGVSYCLCESIFKSENKRASVKIYTIENLPFCIIAAVQDVNVHDCRL